MHVALAGKKRKIFWSDCDITQQRASMHSAKVWFSIEKSSPFIQQLNPSCHNWKEKTECHVYKLLSARVCQQKWQQMEIKNPCHINQRHTLESIEVAAILECRTTVDHSAITAVSWFKNLFDLLNVIFDWHLCKLLSTGLVNNAIKCKNFLEA